MNTLSALERAKRIFYVVHGREPIKGEELTMADSLNFAGLARELSDWAIASGFAKKPI